MRRPKHFGRSIDGLSDDMADGALATVGFSARACLCLINGLLRTDATARKRSRDHWGRVKLCLAGTHA